MLPVNLKVVTRDFGVYFLDRYMCEKVPVCSILIERLDEITQVSALMAWPNVCEYVRPSAPVRQ